jgi:hypothetical protein
MTSSTDEYIQFKLNAILSGDVVTEIALCLENGQEIGVMRPITVSHLKQNYIVEKLTTWRNENMSNFLTHFVATPNRTRAWMQNELFKSCGQMLWLVYDQDHQIVGHFGFKNLNSKSVLLDNALRGERKGHPRLFVAAGKALVKWIWQNTSVNRIDAYVIGDNVPSIMMNRQIGFRGWKRHTLIKQSQGLETHWVIGDEGQPSLDGRCCFTIFIERDGDTFPHSSFN